MDDGCPNFIKKFSKNMKKILKGKNYSDEDVTEEIISMVKEGHEQGVLLDSEAEMIHNIFEFGENEAKDIMTHRKNMIAIDGELSFTDAVDFMIENSKSRYPVRPIISTLEARLVSCTSCTLSSGKPTVLHASRSNSVIAILEWNASFPPRRITALPAIRHSAAASLVTFGRAS